MEEIITNDAREEANSTDDVRRHDPIPHKSAGHAEHDIKSLDEDPKGFRMGWKETNDIARPSQ